MDFKRRLLPALSLLGLIWTGGGLVATAGAQPAEAPQTNPKIYVVTHVDISGNKDILTEATQALVTFAADSQKDPGVIRFELLRQPDRLNHFTIVSVWQNREAFEAHSGAEHTKRFREKVQPMLGSPFDERLHSLLR
jgi:quinol monooxygenase YgiN